MNIGAFKLYFSTLYNNKKKCFVRRLVHELLRFKALAVFMARLCTLLNVDTIGHYFGTSLNTLSHKNELE